MVNVCALCHKLWVRDAIIVLLSFEDEFELKKPHQDAFLDIYSQHDEISHIVAVIHSSLELWVN